MKVYRLSLGDLCFAAASRAQTRWQHLHLLRRSRSGHSVCSCEAQVAFPPIWCLAAEKRSPIVTPDQSKQIPLRECDSADYPRSCRSQPILSTPTPLQIGLYFLSRHKKLLLAALARSVRATRRRFWNERGTPPLMRARQRARHPCSCFVMSLYGRGGAQQVDGAERVS